MKKAARWLAPVLALVLIAPPVAAHAASTTSTTTNRQQEIQDEIARLRDSLDEVAADEADTLADLKVTQRRKADETAQLADIDHQLTTAEAALSVAQSSLDRANANEREATQRVDHANSQLAGARNALKAQAVASFMRYGSGAEKLNVVLKAGDINQLHDAAAFVDALAERQAKIVDQFASLQDDTAALEAAAKASRDTLAAQTSDVKTQADALAAARAQQAAVTASAIAEADHEQTLLDQLKGKKADYERRIREQQQESDSISALLRQHGSSGPRISGHGSLSAPVADPVITSTFGWRIHPIFGDRRLHTGVDFRASTGTPVLAAGPGKVVFAGWQSGYGNCTIIDHGGGIATLYAHQSALGVKVGDHVTRGERIGAAGATGFATGPHVHFEVRVNGTPVDPLPYL